MSASPNPALQRFAINQITTKKWSMAEAIEGYASQGVSGIACWRSYVTDYGLDRTAKHLRDAGMWVASLCTSAWLNVDNDVAMAAALDDNRRLLDMAAKIGAPSLVMVIGGQPEGTKDINGHRSRVKDALSQLAPYAQSVGVKLGIEPLHPMYAGDRSVINTIKMANDLCDVLGQAASLVPDVYHCWWDPDFEGELRRAGPQRISTFHLCDWLVPTRNMFDRGMVGDGVVDIPRIRGWLDSLHYEGPFELEIFSELDWWQRPGEETVRVAIERCAPFVAALAKTPKA